MTVINDVPVINLSPLLSTQKRKHLTDMMVYMPEDEKQFYTSLLSLADKNALSQKVDNSKNKEGDNNYSQKANISKNKQKRKIKKNIFKKE